MTTPSTPALAISPEHLAELQQKAAAQGCVLVTGPSDLFEEVIESVQQAMAGESAPEPERTLAKGAMPDFGEVDPSLELERVWDTPMTEEERQELAMYAELKEDLSGYVQVLPTESRRQVRGFKLKLATAPVGAKDQERLQQVLANLRGRDAFPGYCGWRHTARATDDLDSRLARLADQFPNFREVVEYLRDHAALGMAANGRFQPGPILLEGPAGIGKTEFSRALADVLRLPAPVLIDLASAQTGAQLSGSEAHFSNSKPGVIFQTIVEGSHASPLVLLDELDKARSNGLEDPLGPLYQLLEPSSAKRFADLSFPALPFDCSHILWVATANDCAHVPGPLLSRFERFSVAAPTARQALQIAEKLYADMTAKLKTPLQVEEGFFEELVVGRAVREFKRALQNALARALRQRSPVLCIDHLAVASTPSYQGIGFIRAR